MPPSRGAGAGAVLLIGILFHLVYLRSIFDIYFKSPVVQVEPQFRSTATPPAKRLFLIVGDGLRADKLFQNPQLAPTLHRIARDHGRWGISHTRVPTESRPGHVALIAGLYEDVSAVTTGWQLNPVHFDSVFNQSRRTLSWGSPDILPMFRDGATPPNKIDCHMYDAHEEDFTADSSKLDTWVFDRVSQALGERQGLDQPQTVFFLHLLGLDTAGHGHRPYSQEYLSNIAVVDKGISALLQQLEEVLSPQELTETAFVFTADHGMSDWGSHGDGHPDNTQTPYIVWGAGIRRPTKVSTSLPMPFDTPTTLTSRERIDIAQADLAPLMSYLLGIHYPKNNVGRLPIDLLEAPIDDRLTALLQNARQIHAQYESKRELKISQLHLSRLVDFVFSRSFEVDIAAALTGKDWHSTRDLIDLYIVESLEGMRYLQRYDWFYLRTIVTLGYVGWMLYTAIFVLTAYTSAGAVPSRPHPTQRYVFGSATVLTTAFLLERSAQISYYAYAAFPLWFWYNIACDWRVLIPRNPNPKQVVTLVTIAALTLQGIVLTYADRRAMSLLLLGLAATPFCYAAVTPALRLRWLALCVTCSLFTLLPTVQSEDVRPVVLGGVLMATVGFAYILRKDGGFVLGCQVGIVILATAVTYRSSTSLSLKQGLPRSHQIAGWATLLSSWAFGVLSRAPRDITLFLTFAPTFVLLSVSYEGLFYVAFWGLLTTWVAVESEISGPITSGRPPTLSDTRIALTILVLVQEAFFGTGNIASVSSFTLDSVYRLIPIFNPFAMTLLLLYKLLVPFAVLSLHLGLLNERLGMGRSALCMIVLCVCDILTLAFFWQVRDEGSWLEIGSSISQFVIAGLLSLFIVSLERVSEWMR